MPYSLQAFHFSAIKIGQIIHQYCRERGITQTALAARTGYSYDTIGNTFSGKVQDVPFERLFKLCVALAIPLEVLMQLMLEGEEIDFADRVLLYDPRRDTVIPSTAQTITDAEIVSDKVAEAAQPVPPQPRTPMHTESATRDEMRAYIDELNRLHDRERAALCEQLERQDKIIHKLLDRR